MEISSENKGVEDAEYRCYEELEKPLPSPPSLTTSKTHLTFEAKLEALRLDIIGSYAKFLSPFGERPILYADWTASSRCVGRVEDFIRSVVLPFYGNTHTTSSVTGHQATCFRHEARQIVAESVNAKVTGKAAEDVVLFCGGGTTSCVDKLLSLLGLNAPFATEIVSSSDDIFRPVVFVSPYEHHSNLIPWREARATVVTVG
ncbi:aminotransferase class V-fold PLP-dependent enzyme, partial [archaeon]